MLPPSRQLLRALRSSVFSRASPCLRPKLATFNARSTRTLRTSTHHRGFATSQCRPYSPPPAPKNTDRGPVSDEDTQTDFGTMNVLGNTPSPTTAIDACLDDGFHLNNGVKITGGDGCLLVGGEAFAWRPWKVAGESRGRKGSMINKKGQWEVGSEAWGLFDLVWPKPDLLILGLGASTYPIAPETRKYINSLGIRVDVQDTRNASAQFNLLATERGVGNIAAAFIPVGWKGK